MPGGKGLGFGEGCCNGGGERGKGQGMSHAVISTSLLLGSWRIYTENLFSPIQCN